MKIANASKAYDSPHQHISDSPFPMIKLKPPQKKVICSIQLSNTQVPRYLLFCKGGIFSAHVRTLVSTKLTPYVGITLYMKL